jgi:hypothetical protein
VDVAVLTRKATSDPLPEYGQQQERRRRNLYIGAVVGVLGVTEFSS